MKENNYKLNKSDSDKIESVTEKLYQDREQFRGKMISWEDFWSKLLRYELPDNDLTRHYWVNIRPVYVAAINAQFARSNYPCVLTVSYDNGVILLIDVEAALHTSVKYTNKVINAVKNSKNAVESCQDAFTDPVERKILKTTLRFIDNALYSSIGMVLSSELPDDRKKNLISKIQKALPQSQEE